VATLAATRWVYDFTDGAREMRALLGGKGANVAEMTRILGPELVPVGFTMFANEPPPANLRTLAGRITEPVLLIAAPNSPNGEELNRGYHAAIKGPKALWEIPEAEHTGGLAARPAEYERRVVGFFDRTLR
jgi:hypothetical protein